MHNLQLFAPRYSQLYLGAVTSILEIMDNLIITITSLFNVANNIKNYIQNIAASGKILGNYIILNTKVPGFDVFYCCT